MKKRKSLKVISAATVAASAFVAAAPTEAATVSQVDKLVKTAKDAGTVLKWAISIEGKADGTTRPWAAYNNAKVAYDNAVKAVNRLPASQKNRYMAELDEQVKLHINRTMFYIDAITAGEKIKEKQNALAYQMNADLINDYTEKAYHELSNEIRKQAILLDRVYGKSTRDLIRSQYKQSAEKVRDNAKYPVTVKMEIDLAQKAISSKDSKEAEKHIAEAKRYLKYVDNASINRTLTDQLNKIETSFIPKVEKVSAAEPKRIKVDFNKAMLANTGRNGAENRDNYKVSGETIKNVKLINDNKTALIELEDPLYTNSSYTVTVKGNIQTVNYESLSENDYKTTFTFSDKIKPTVHIITSNSDGSIDIVFSELIARNSPINITLDGKSVKDYTLKTDSDTIVLPRSETDRLGLKRGKSYSIIISGAKDLVVNTPNSMETYRGTFTYTPAVNITAPEVKEIQVKDEKTITIEFSKALASSLSSSNLTITKGNSTVRASTIKDVSDGDKTKFDIELPASTYGANDLSVRLNIEVKSYKDLAGNIGRTTDRSLTLSKDLTPPKLVKSTYDRKTDEFQLTFDKPFKLGSKPTDKVVMYDSNTNVHKPASIKVNDDKLIIDAKKLADDVYHIDVSKGLVMDTSLSQNESLSFTTTVTKKLDNEKPEIKLVDAGNNGKITIVFSKEIDVNSATSLANYTIDNRSLSSATTFNVSTNNKVVTINLTEGTIPETDKYKLTIKGIKDQSKNTMDSYSTTIYLTDNTKPILNDAKLIDEKIILKFSEQINLPDDGKTNFDIQVNGQTLSSTQYTIKTSSNKKELIIYPESNTIFNGNITIKTTNKATITDNADNTLKADTLVTAN